MANPTTFDADAFAAALMELPSLRPGRGVYIITSLLPGDRQPQYRIKHPSEEFERVAMEGELSASEPEHGQR